jgi:tRNA-specific 2-thiouridylase
VVAKYMARNTLIVAQGENHPALFCRRLETGPINWLGMPMNHGDLAVRLRYRQADQPARIDVASQAGLLITPQVPQRAVTPGQSAVLYSGSRCLGGGVIRRTDI